MEDKYSMSIDGNIFYAKRNIVDSIWKSANLEGISVTFPQTFEIYEGRVVNGMSVDDTIAINNLKHSWNFILEQIELFKDSSEEVSLRFIKQVNSLVGRGIVSNAGEFRIGSVRIGGTTWQPDVPRYGDLLKEIESINSIENDTDRAISLMLFIMRSQMFWDGNKRTATLCCNYELIRNGRGTFDVPIAKQEEFRLLLVEYYKSGDSSNIKEFIYKYCLDGTSL